MVNWRKKMGIDKNSLVNKIKEMDCPLKQEVEGEKLYALKYNCLNTADCKYKSEVLTGIPSQNKPKCWYDLVNAPPTGKKYRR